MKRRTKAGLAVLVALVGLSLWQFLKEAYGVGVDSVWWLPRESRNITYISNDLIRMAEFDIEREAFEKWCARRKKPLRELGNNEHQTVYRCLPLLERRGAIPPIPEPNEFGTWSGIKRLGAEDLFFEERWDNGGGYTIGYDVREKRGYYDYSRH